VASREVPLVIAFPTRLTALEAARLREQPTPDP
jgi:hypothetical protein